MAKAPKQPAWLTNPPTNLTERVQVLQDTAGQYTHDSPEGVMLARMMRLVEEEMSEIEQAQIAECPPAFFVPSYEQALVLNAWMYGIDFLCIYASNRIGKTTVEVMNWILWAFPNDPEWMIFQPYTDEWGRKVQVFPRPSFASVIKIRDWTKKYGWVADPDLPPYDPINVEFLQNLQKHDPLILTLQFPRPPWDRSGVLWVGAPDQVHHEQIIIPLWEKYLPKGSVTRISYADREMTIVIKPTEGKEIIWEWVGKSYEVKDTKFSSGAVDAIILTEGVSWKIFKELSLRFKEPSFGGHDYTPYDAANQGEASALARSIHLRNDPQKMWPKSYHTFVGFSVAKTPDHILPTYKKEKMIAQWANTDEGKARLNGEFYTSSGLVVSSLDKERHMLPWDLKDLLEKFPECKLYRGLDPGIDHPTACAWAAINKHHQMFVYRIVSRRGLTVRQRCELVIKKSGNKIEPHPDNEQMRVEVLVDANSERIEQTFMDYHAFSTDENSGQSRALNYILQGLQVTESTTQGPEDRVDALNDKLAPSKFLPPVSKRDEETGEGCRVYFLMKGEGIKETIAIWDEMFWQTYMAGDKKGLPKEKVPTHGDDELDAVCYVTGSGIRWTPISRFDIMIGLGYKEDADSNDEDESTE